MLEPEPAGLLEPLPEQEPMGRLEPSSLRHPYTEPNEPAETTLATTPTDADQSARTPPAAKRGTADPGSAAPAVAHPSSDPPAASPAEPARPSAQPGKAATGKADTEKAARARSALVESADRAPAGSLADLRSRLARLPDGHPSSPYEDDGHARPLPIRLKQLELGLPTPSREAAAGSVPEVEAADTRLDHGLDSTDPADDLAVDVPAPAALDARPAVDPAAGSDSGPAGLPRSSPASPELADPYPASGNGPAGRTSAASSPRADLTLSPWQATPSPRVSGLEGLSRRGGNGHGPGNGHGDSSRRRESPAEGDRPGRAPAEPDRRDTSDYRVAKPPSADLRELVERTVATGRTAEGRNVFGSYGSSGLTPMMQRIAAHLPFGGLAPDSEANSLKSSERLSAKLARLLARNPGRTAEELAATIGDVVRYAFAFEAADYVEGTWLVHRRLKSHGFELEIRRNRWESPEYKGIFTQWRDPAHQIPFEVQFHTTASWAVVQRSHEAYVQITDPATPPAERARLRACQVAAAATAKAPPNWAELGDFRLEAR
jgi:hypothetical protein